MEITWEDVKNTAMLLGEDLDEFTPAQEKLVLDLSNRRVPENRFNEDTFDARCYYAAHHATVRFGPSAGEGTTSSESIGGVSVTKTMPVNNPDSKHNTESTAFGREYLELRKTNYQPFHFE